MRSSFRSLQGLRLMKPSVAFVVDHPKAPFTLRPIRLDEVRDNELLIDMRYSGICHTDVAIQQGHLDMVQFPAIFGHEGAGIIRAIGSKVKNKKLKVGDPVLLSYNTCDKCPACLRGERAFCHDHPQVNHNAVRCSDRSTPASLEDGTPVRSQYFGQSSFSKHSVVHENTVIAANSTDNLHLYAPLGCGIQTGAGTIFNLVKPTIDDTIAIYGLGAVGLAAVMAAKHLGVRKIIAVDLLAQRLKLATELGATHPINSTTAPNVPFIIKSITKGGATYAVDCTGSTKVIQDCSESVGHQGKVISLGVPRAGAKVTFDALNFLLHNKTYSGIIQGGSNPRELLPYLVELHRQGRFPLERIIKVYPYSQMETAISDMQQGSVVKPVIAWE